MVILVSIGIVVGMVTEVALMMHTLFLRRYGQGDPDQNSQGCQQQQCLHYP